MKQNESTTTVQQNESRMSIGTILSNIWQEGYSAAHYRLPGDSNKYLVIDLSGLQKIADPELESMAPGFIFAPFEHTPEKERWFIRADVVIKEHKGHCSLVAATKNSTTDIEARLFDEHSAHLNTHINGAYYRRPVREKGSTTHAAYTRMIRKGIDMIDTGEFQKVVPARQMQIRLPESFDPVALFNKLCAQYPNTFVSLVTTPRTGTWIGASPEILLRIDAESVFSTMALAGTQPYRENIQLTEVAWTQKDIEEQAMVSRYIINCFKQIRLREFEEIGPKTIKAGNLIHLKTHYQVDLKKVHFPRLGSIMLKLLHPTSAVCGLPEAPAMDFILELESFDRDFFTGYLGPVNMNNETNVYVNLRCMNLLEKQALLYAGAGVTIDSDPEKEWMETEIKLKTLLDLI